MTKHKKESLVAAVVCAIALPVVWCIIVLLYGELHRRFKPELLYEVLMLPVYPVRKIAPLLDISGSYIDITHVVGVLLFLACIGFSLGFLVTWSFEYLKNKDRDYEK